MREGEGKAIRAEHVDERNRKQQIGQARIGQMGGTARGGKGVNYRIISGAKGQYFLLLVLRMGSRPVGCTRTGGEAY